LRCIAIQLAFRSNTVLRGIVAVVALIIKRSSNALIIGRNRTRPEQRAPVVLAMIHLRNSVGLYQILISVTDIVNDAKVRLQDCVLVHERRVEFELVAQRRSAQSHVVTSGNVDLIKHIVVEVILVRSHAGFFVWINA
jgi:hypothetical protein